MGWSGDSHTRTGARNMAEHRKAKRDRAEQIAAEVKERELARLAAMPPPQSDETVTKPGKKRSRQRRSSLAATGGTGENQGAIKPTSPEVSR